MFKSGWDFTPFISIITGCYNIKRWCEVWGYINCSFVRTPTPFILASVGPKWSLRH